MYGEDDGPHRWEIWGPSATGLETKSENIKQALRMSSQFLEDPRGTAVSEKLSPAEICWNSGIRWKNFKAVKREGMEIPEIYSFPFIWFSGSGWMLILWFKQNQLSRIPRFLYCHNRRNRRLKEVTYKQYGHSANKYFHHGQSIFLESILKLCPFSQKTSRKVFYYC